MEVKPATSSTDEEESRQLCENANTRLFAIEDADDDDEDEESPLDPEELAEIMLAFERAVTLDAKNIEGYLGQAYVFGMQEQYDKGFEVLEKAKSLFPEDKRVGDMLKELNKMAHPEQHANDEEEEDEEGEEEGDEEEEEGEDAEEGEEDEEDEEEEVDSPDADKGEEKTEGKKEGKKEEEEQTTTTTNNNSSPGDPLVLVESGTMTKAFYDVLTKIFRYFDKDRDEALNSEELNNFWLAVNGQPIDADSLQFLRSHFHHYNKRDKKRKPRMSHTGFLELFLSQTAGNSEETFADLLKLGFNNKLQPIDDRYKNVK